MRGYNRLVGSFHNMGTVLGPVDIHKATLISGHFDFIRCSAGK